MRILSSVAATPEQLRILSDSGPGFRLVRGAAGSGKTTSALLRLRQLCSSRLTRRARLGVDEPIRVLVLTYNRTLEGYIAELARSQVARGPGLILEVSTFGKWARSMVGNVDILDRDRASSLMRRHLIDLFDNKRSFDFLVDEIEYVLSRFSPDDLAAYLGRERTGRGLSPRMDVALRTRLLDEAIAPYQAAKSDLGVLDWNDLAIAVQHFIGPSYDVVIVDEAQDFSANQIRAVISHLNQEHSTTFVLDAVQRIYPRFFTWAEVGVTLLPSHIYLLTQNHRNTAEIAAFATPLVEGLPLEDDGTLPDFTACRQSGLRPKVIAGTYRQQLDYMLAEILRRVDLTSESVGILQPKGGNWFSFARSALRARGVPFCELTRQSVWPSGPEQVAVSTIHSAKGLEFDHVLLPGLNQEVTPHGTDEGDASLDRLRRLLAMGIGRARSSVMVGFKPGEASSLIGMLDRTTYDPVVL